MIDSYEFAGQSIPVRQRAIDTALNMWITDDGRQPAEWAATPEAETEGLRGMLTVIMRQFDHLPEGSRARAQAELDDEIVAQARARIRAARAGDAERLRDLIAAGAYSQRGAARELQISERMMRYYCSGEQPVPRAVMLAMEHLVNCPHNQKR